MRNAAHSSRAALLCPNVPGALFLTMSSLHVQTTASECTLVALLAASCWLCLCA